MKGDSMTRILRENFIERIFALKRFRETLDPSFTSKDLVEFHTRHKFLILSHSPSHYRRMGPLVAQPDSLPLKERIQTYQELFLEALQIKTTPKKHADVLLHMMGFFKKELSPDEKRELIEIIDHFKAGPDPFDRAHNPVPALCAQI